MGDTVFTGVRRNPKGNKAQKSEEAERTLSRRLQGPAPHPEHGAKETNFSPVTPGTQEHSLWLGMRLPAPGKQPDPWCSMVAWLLVATAILHRVAYTVLRTDHRAAAELGAPPVLLPGISIRHSWA